MLGWCVGGIYLLDLLLWLLRRDRGFDVLLELDGDGLDLAGGGQGAGDAGADHGIGGEEGARGPCDDDVDVVALAERAGPLNGDQGAGARDVAGPPGGPRPAARSRERTPGCW